MDPFRSPENPAVGSVTGITGVERFGVDTLVWEGNRLIVRTAREMPSWRVGRNRRTAVHFRGLRYVVVATHAELGKFEYTLELWPERAHDLPARDIHYDEAYVRDREDEARMRETMGRQAYGLIPAWPFLGFLPSGWKTALHRNYGVEALSATRRSVWLEGALALIALVFLTLYAWTGLDVVTGQFWRGPGVALVALLVFLPDFVLRSSILVDDDFPRFGFYEWIFHRELMRVLRKGWHVARARVRARRDRRSR
jgi:hypothetical protein